MTAIVGDDPDWWQDRVGQFVQEMPLASDAGIDILAGPRDVGRVRRELAAAGYSGERVVLLDAVDLPVIHGIAQVGADALRRSGMNVDLQSMDFGTMIGRQNSKEPVAKGGWSIAFTFIDGLVTSNPRNNIMIAANGVKAAPGWPTSERIEALRAEWLQAGDLPTQKRICRDLQLQLWQDVPYIPTGAYYQPTAMRADLTGVMKGTPQFYGIARSQS